MFWVKLFIITSENIYNRRKSIFIKIECGVCLIIYILYNNLFLLIEFYYYLF